MVGEVRPTAAGFTLCSDSCDDFIQRYVCVMLNITRYEAYCMKKSPKFTR